MFWELSEAVIKFTIFFQILNFDLVKDAMSCLYFNEESDYSEENTCENKSSTPP